MKKTTIFATAMFAFAVLGSANLSAQDTAPASTTPLESVASPTTVNIILNDVLSIEHGPGANAKEVNFTYATASDYNTDQNQSVPNTLLVTSSKRFQLKVEAQGPNFVSPTAKDEVIPISVMNISVNSGDALPAVNINKPVTLAVTPQEILSKGLVGARKSVGILYTIPAAQAQKHLIGKPEATYTQKVVFTATSL